MTKIVTVIKPNNSKDCVILAPFLIDAHESFIYDNSSKSFHIHAEASDMQATLRTFEGVIDYTITEQVMNDKGQFICLRSEFKNQ